MSLQSARDLENTRSKLAKLEERYAALQAKTAPTGTERVREWTMLSLKKLINQFKEEISRFEARTGRM
jgi:hypothetical protein